MSVLLRILKRHEVHATLSAEVPGVEPIPVLKLVPWFPPWQEVMMVTILLMILPLLTQLHLGLVEEWPTILPNPGLLLTHHYPDPEYHQTQRCKDHDEILDGVGETDDEILDGVGETVNHHLTTCHLYRCCTPHTSLCQWLGEDDFFIDNISGKSKLIKQIFGSFLII